MNYQKIEQKWQKKWKDEKLFEPSIDAKKEGFYVQVAYPYPSGAMHIGHARTYTVTDIAAKYHKLKGFNVLMPMGWHVSGIPVIATVELIHNKDEKTLSKMKNVFKIPEKDLKELDTPEGFVNYFVNKAEYGYKNGFGILGFGIDWRRELTTVDPQYNKFIQWQYRKLHSKGLVGKGTYPVRYCPHDENAVGDHDLSEGEGVGIQEFTLLKFKYKDMFITAATLRPETVYGQTNIWVDPETEYVIAKVDNEKWILSKEASEKLKFQNKKIGIVGKIKGIEMIGDKAEAPMIHKELPIFPSHFCNPAIGTGIVTSVPSDAPDDYIGLKDLWENEEECKKYGLRAEDVKKIEIIPIITSEKLGDLAAVKIVQEMGIKNQNERGKLEEAKKIVYKEGYHKGVMNKNCGKYAGMKVEKAKNTVKNEMIKAKEADLFYELENSVVCRCGTKCVVSLLSDQWFVKYGDIKWKKESEQTLKNMKIVPELFRTQYENVFGWLEDKPCTRAKGLGTKFPWDENQIVEPLGDSTIYMAYFTISHIVKTIDAKKLNDAVFDYVFLGKGNSEKITKETGIEKKKIEQMRKEFDYWYPLAFNVSATELIPNHMSFSIFQHTAIFPKNKRQRGTLNLGMLVIEGQKMASSKGNVVLVNDICKEIGTDMLRFFLMNFMEPWMEANWKQSDVETGLKAMNNFIGKLYETAEEVKNAKVINEKKLSEADNWILNQFKIKKNCAIDAYETMHLRSAMQELAFKFINDLKWYERRTDGKLNSEIMKKMISEWTILMSPVMPHICEEIWESLGNKKSVFESKLPKKEKIDDKIEKQEELLREILTDVIEIKKLSGIEKPKRIVIYTSPKWKWDAIKKIAEVTKDRPDFGKAMSVVMKIQEARDERKNAEKFVKASMKRAAQIEGLKEMDELKIIENAKTFLEKETNSKIEVYSAEKPKEDSANKAKNAMPLKPAIFIE
ncbi:MAG: leucine--tRNA ligase [Candidatus Diapherotrites archaeon]